MKIYIYIFLFFTSISSSFANECTVQERMAGFLLEATNKTIQSNLPYIKYLHVNSFFPAPAEEFDQVTIDYRIKSISAIDDSGFEYYELDRNSVYTIDVELKIIGNIKNDKFQPLSETRIISYIWGHYENEWYILDIIELSPKVYTAESYLKWLNAKTPENYTMVIRDIENAVEQEASAAGNGAEKTE
jgi:hypothetical protein